MYTVNYTALQESHRILQKRLNHLQSMIVEFSYDLTDKDADTLLTVQCAMDTASKHLATIWNKDEKHAV